MMITELEHPSSPDIGARLADVLTPALMGSVESAASTVIREVGADIVSRQKAASVLCAWAQDGSADVAPRFLAIASRVVSQGSE
jgi:hypothetical protein